MDENSTKIRAENARSTDPPSVSSSELLAGHRELIIRHDGGQYRLRLTSTNKLILVK